MIYWNYSKLPLETQAMHSMRIYARMLQTAWILRGNRVKMGGNLKETGGGRMVYLIEAGELRPDRPDAAGKRVCVTDFSALAEAAGVLGGGCAHP